MGWRFIYFIAAGLMVVCLLIIIKDTPGPSFQLSGKLCGLMKSLFSIVKKYPQLRIASLRAGFSFGSFLAMWSCLAFKDGTGAFLCGKQYHRNAGTLWHSGALTASSIGRFINTVGVKRLTYIGCSLIISAWIVLYAGQYSYAGIIAGILLIDIGMQCIQLSNQTSAFAPLSAGIQSHQYYFHDYLFHWRFHGTFLAGTFWQWFGWTGVVGTGILLTSCSLLINIFAKK